MDKADFNIVERLCARKIKKIKGLEPGITQVVIDSTLNSNSYPALLEHRIKTVSSLSSKILRDFAMNAIGEDIKSFAEKDIEITKDLIRYTIVIAGDMSEAIIKSIIYIRDKNYNLYSMKNRFIEKAPKDFRAIFYSSENSDIKFEVQYHNISSYFVDINSHQLYELIRDENNFTGSPSSLRKRVAQCRFDLYKIVECPSPNVQKTIMNYCKSIQK